MFRQFRIGILLMVAILAMGVGVALSDRGRVGKGPTDLAGEWLLDRAHSDFGKGGQGEWRGRRGPREGGRRPMLPDLIRIEQTSTMVTIADSSGTPLEEIVIGSAPTEQNPLAAPDVRTASGEWRKDGLEAVRQGPRGKMTQVFALEDKGKVLTIKMKRESEGRGSSREIMRTYRRVST